MLKPALLTCSSLLFAAFAFAQEPTPLLRDATAKKAAPTYDEKADGRAQVTAALARAKQDNKRVLIQWGANWCGWCNWLAGTMQGNAEVANELRSEYVLVKLDVGQFNKHVELAKELGAELKVVIKGIPFLTVLDADGKALVQQATEPFETKDENGKGSHDPKKLVEFLVKNRAAALPAKDVRATAVARAKAEQKLAFVHFGGPGCSWCRRLEEWMARPEIAAVLEKAFVDCKIDIGRMPGGKEVLAAEETAAGVKSDGIPWIVFLDGEGAIRAHGTGPKGTIGFPFEISEVELFATMLTQAKVKLSDGEVQTLIDSLHQNREASKKPAPATGK